MWWFSAFNVIQWHRSEAQDRPVPARRSHRRAKHGVMTPQGLKSIRTPQNEDRRQWRVISLVSTPTTTIGMRPGFGPTTAWLHGSTTTAVAAPAVTWKRITWVRRRYSPYPIHWTEPKHIINNTSPDRIHPSGWPKTGYITCLILHPDLTQVVRSPFCPDMILCSWLAAEYQASIMHYHLSNQGTFLTIQAKWCRVSKWILTSAAWGHFRTNTKQVKAHSKLFFMSRTTLVSNKNTFTLNQARLCLPHNHCPSNGKVGMINYGFEVQPQVHSFSLNASDFTVK